jgi:serine/threonine protein kinase
MERIAIGGTAEVFNAVFVGQHGASDKPVVVKRVLPQLARDERFRHLFFEEACLAATLSHPNVVKVLDYGDLGDTCFIAMERIDGQDLEQLLAMARAAGTPRPIEPALAALVAADVGDALQFIHQHTSSEGLPLQIIHRDVSPHNILVSFQGDVKLTDFGIAKSVIRREHTVDGTLRGKLEYMAPEQALPEQKVDHRADLFALGCVIYEMLEGRPPLRGTSEIDTLQRVKEVRIELPPDRLDAPAPLRQVIDRLLRADPSERYATASEVVASLHAYLESCSETPKRSALGQWARMLAREEKGDGSDNSVDLAVRALLGDNPAEAPESPLEVSGASRPVTTSVFALEGGTLEAPGAGQHGPPAARAPGLVGASEPISASDLTHGTQRRRAYPWRIIVPLALFGLTGWTLWGLQLVSEPSSDDVAYGDTDVEKSAGELVQGPPEEALADRRDRSKRRLAARNRSRRAARRRRASAKAKRAAEARDASAGYLTVNSLPWSRVYLNGHYVGNTPLVRHQARSGTHRIELRGPKGELRRSFRATVRPAQTVPFTFDFRTNATGTDAR